MTNAVFSTGPITKEVSALVHKFRFVELTNDKVAEATGAKLPYGYVRQAAAPQVREENGLAYGLPEHVAVVTHQAVVDVETAEESFAVGATVYAAAEGKAAASGTVAVGIAERDVQNGRVRVHMFHPSIFAAAGAE